jgi:hypothetical protein
VKSRDLKWDEVQLNAVKGRELRGKDVKFILG